MGGAQSKPAAGPQPTAPTSQQVLPTPSELQGNTKDALPEPAAATSASDETSTSGTGVGGGGGGCPMKLEGGGYRFGGWLGMKSLPKGHPSMAASNVSSGNAAQSDEGGGGFPIKAAPKADDRSPPQTGQSSGGGCPVQQGGGPGKPAQVQYNVYSQPIDPTNQMPAVANQLPNPLQKEELSTSRVRSTIPKGGADHGSTWTYPSPQMFFNSLARKGKLADTDESVIDSVVALHNNMNEKTWAKVLEWEAVSNPAGEVKGGPKLLRFMGRPSDLSPKARFKSWVLGHPLPFDRHDWTVVRPDGTEVRYVIDYYHDESRAREDADSAMPSMHDREAVQSILVDVRPALDGPRSLVERVFTMPYARRVGISTEFEPLPMMPTKALKEQMGESQKVWENIQKNVRDSTCKGGDEEEAKTIMVGREDEEEAKVKISDEEARALAKSFASMLNDCQDAQRAVDACKDEAECAKASLALTMCMAKIFCPLQHDAVTKSLNTDYDPNDEKAVAEYNARVDKTLENVTACVAGVSERATIARMVHPDVFKGEKA